MCQKPKRTKFFIFYGLIISAFFIFGCTRHPMDGSGRGWDHMMGYGNYGGMFMWLIGLIILGVVVYLVVNRTKSIGRPGGPESERPEDILKRRYANGEITREEYERLKKDIEG